MKAEKDKTKTMEMDHSINNKKEFKLESYIENLKDMKQKFSDLKIHYNLYKEGVK